jgi:hypothetical protein
MEGVHTVLQEMNLQQYGTLFHHLLALQTYSPTSPVTFTRTLIAAVLEVEGFDSVPALMFATDADLETIGLRRGHRRYLIGKLHQPNRDASPPRQSLECGSRDRSRTRSESRESTLPGQEDDAEDEESEGDGEGDGEGDEGDEEEEEEEAEEEGKEVEVADEVTSDVVEGAFDEATVEETGGEEEGDAEEGDAEGDEGEEEEAEEEETTADP